MSGDPSQTTESVLAAHDLIVALERLFTIGSFYPRTHVRCHDVAEKLAARVQQIAGGERSVRIEVGGDGLAVNAVPVPLTGPGATRVHRLLHSLGIGYLEIEARATRDDLLDFAVRILRDKIRLDGAQTLKQIDFADLPSAVRVARREFGARGGSGAISGPAADRVERVLQALEELDLTDEAREACRELVQAVLGAVAHGFEREGGTAPRALAPERKLDEALEVAAGALQSAIAEMIASGGDLSDPEAVAARIEKTLSTTDHPDTAAAILDAIRETAHPGNLEASDATAERALAASDHTRSRSEFLDALGAYGAGELSVSSHTDRGEYLSVLLQMLGRHPAPSLLARIQSELQRAVSGRLSGGEKDVLIGALADLLASSDLPLVDRVLPPILAERRRTRTSAAAELLVRLAGDADPKAAEALWPHLANELLRGPGGLPSATAHMLSSLVAAQPREVIRRHLSRLVEFDALASGSFDAALACPPSPQLATLFEELLSTPRESVIGAAVLAGFQRQRPAWPGAEVLAAIPVYNRNLRPFLALVLRAETEGRPAPELLAMAGRLLEQTLPELSTDGLRKPWVPAAIAALGELRGQEAEPLLVAIVRARQFIFLHLWPAPCRRAAREALKNVRARKTSTGPRIGGPTTASAGEEM